MLKQAIFTHMSSKEEEPEEAKLSEAPENQLNESHSAARHENGSPECSEKDDQQPLTVVPAEAKTTEQNGKNMLKVYFLSLLMLSLSSWFTFNFQLLLPIP